MNITYSKPDMHVSFKEHLKHGNVWSAEITLPMQGSPQEPPSTLDVLVDVIAPNKELAQYIVTTMYPDYESIYIQDNNAEEDIL